MFASQVGQIGRSVANGSPPPRRFFVAVLLRREAAETGRATRCTLRRNNATVRKI